MTAILPIVGVHHHHTGDTARWIASLPQATEVLLLPEPSNTFDRMAVQAYIREECVGYLSSDFLDIYHLNYPDGRGAWARLAHHPYLDEISTFFVEISLDNPEFPDYQLQIDISPIAGLPVPRFGTKLELTLARMMSDCTAWSVAAEKGVANEESFLSLLSLAERFLSIFGQSLSCDHLRLYLQLYILLESSLDTRLSDQLRCEIFDMLQSLLDIRTDYASSPEKCEQLFRNERAIVQTEAAAFLTDYRRLLTSHTYSADEMMKELDSRLRALPNQLYSLLDEPDTFAYRLLYMRLSSVELHTIMLLLICRDAIRLTKPTPEQEAKLRIKAFPYWNNPTMHEKMQAYSSLCEAARQENAASSIARAVIRLQEERVLLKKVCLTDLAAAINDLLLSAIIPDSFRRAMNRLRSKK